jgi:hypothetical protein
MVPSVPNSSHRPAASAPLILEQIKGFVPRLITIPKEGEGETKLIGWNTPILSLTPGRL